MAVPVVVAFFLVTGCASESTIIPSNDVGEIYQTAINGRVWTANWSDGHVRQLASGQRDSRDALVRARGRGIVSIDGDGVATVSGDSPRIYVYDEEQELKWGNIEVTIYGRRDGETTTLSSQGLVIGGRSEHQDSHQNVCAGQVYYARLLYDGRVNFQKEFVHHSVYSSPLPANSYADWSSVGGEFPVGKWVGLKFIVRNLGTGAVSLEMYRDLTEGKNGGTWELIASYVDDGEWSRSDVVEAQRAGCAEIPLVFTEPATSVFIRNDAVIGMSYRDFSIREIEPSRGPGL